MDTGRSTIIGQDGNDFLSGGFGSNTLTGDAGNDTLTGEQVVIIFMVPGRWLL